MAEEAVPQDPRPLPDEPLVVDLLNTRWNNGGNPRDLLASVDDLAFWLRANGFADQVPANDATRDALVLTREVIKRLVDGEDGPQLRAELNSVLAHGSVRRSLAEDGPAEQVEVDAPAWLPAWAAAADYLRMLVEAPGRIRSCAHPSCILYFHDTSKNGTRRWHSMATCGNRAKASRHYARAKA
ncbi:CGNR zinc finger domain-containing protein [Kitasatospora sp. RB6PN24]|uniref:CGNR zinc finger domain-containing protein n=1 Tax=Kitasatospora humi TaxID=2893891 RepID=UPI001E44E2D5|nr:CGNR zinc finger domain-containing protein [Kitasatospora humi]MCC9309826.1 CGNR zinc finger domain-containing protein [Kitasatospora humi]